MTEIAAIDWYGRWETSFSLKTLLYFFLYHFSGITIELLIFLCFLFSVNSFWTELYGTVSEVRHHGTWKHCSVFIFSIVWSAADCQMI